MYLCCVDIQYVVVKVRVNEKGSSLDFVDYVMVLEVVINLVFRFLKYCKNNLMVQFLELYLVVMDNVSVFNKFFFMGFCVLLSEEYVLFEFYIKDLKYFVIVDGIVIDMCFVVI